MRYDEERAADARLRLWTTQGGTIFLEAADALLVSDDEGESWRPLVGREPAPNETGPAVARPGLLPRLGG